MRYTLNAFGKVLAAFLTPAVVSFFVTLQRSFEIQQSHEVSSSIGYIFAAVYVFFLPFTLLFLLPLSLLADMTIARILHTLRQKQRHFITIIVSLFVYGALGMLGGWLGGLMIQHWYQMSMTILLAILFWGLQTVISMALIFFVRRK